MSTRYRGAALVGVMASVLGQSYVYLTIHRIQSSPLRDAR
jgi:hypothetical protein